MDAAYDNSAVEKSGNTADTSGLENGSNILIAYFSRAGENYGVGNIEVGNTQKVAEIIADETGGNLFHIQTATPYPESYDECLEVAKKELDQNARPELAEKVENFDSYDIIYLGYPIWWSNLPMPVYTFMESYNFSGKQVYPFSTNESSGLAGTVTDIKEAIPGATVHEAFSIKGSVAQFEPDKTREEVTNWLKENE